MIIIPAQRDEGRTKCKVSKQMAHLVARMFRAFTNLKEEMHYAVSSRRTFRYAKWPHTFKLTLHETIRKDNF